MAISGKLVFPFDFVRVTNDKLADDGLELGSLVFIAGSKALPVSEEDPYTQRVKLFVHPVVDEEVVLDKGFFMIDPASVERIDDEENKRLYDKLTARAAEMNDNDLQVDFTDDNLTD